MSTDILKALIVAVAVSWGLLVVGSTVWPYRLFNSVFLAAGIVLAAVLVVYLCTEDLLSSVFAVFIGILAVLLLVPFLLIHNGIRMIRREGRSLANVLSLFLGIAVEIGELSFFMAVIFNYSMGLEFFRKINSALLFVGVSVFYFSLLILMFVLYQIYFQYIPHRNGFDHIIIHGCGLLQGYRVSRLLGNRIDRAIEVFHKGNDRAVIICSGGKGSDESISEAEAIAGYLRDKGIPEDRIILEDRSTSTEENLIFSNEIIQRSGGSGRIALVSSNYHIYRCVLLAHRLGMHCVGIGGKVAAYYWPSAVIREFAAVYSDRKMLLKTLIVYLIVVSPFIYMLRSM